MSTTSRLISIVVAVLVVIAVCVGVFYTYTVLYPQGMFVIDPLVQQLNNKRMAGDYQGVLADDAAIQSDPNKSNEDKALATISSVGASFHVSASISDRLKDVDNLKQIVIDTTLPASVRVKALNTLASQYSDSGRNPAVFTEMYKDEPFSKFLVQGDPEASAKNLFEWSYSISPTSVAAIRVAKWYSEQPLFHRELSKDVKLQDVKTAGEWLPKADAASLAELKKDPSFLTTTDYVNFLYFRVMVIGRSAAADRKLKETDNPFEGQYRDAFDSYILFALTGQNVMATEYLYYARFTYANELVADNDSASAKIQLDTLAKELNALKDPAAHGFPNFLVNTHTFSPTGVNWTAMPKLFAVSPDFKAATDHILAVVPVQTASSSGPQLPITDGY